jgi:integrase
VDLARVYIKSPKVRVGVGTDVEVFALNSTLCPVAALKKYIALSTPDTYRQDLPLFRQESGANYYKSLFNKHLRSLLQSDINYAQGDKITTHSFRAGIASHMEQWGFSSSDIQGWGRWSSSAYKRYCRLPVLARRRLAEQLQEQFDSQLRVATSPP